MIDDISYIGMIVIVLVTFAYTVWTYRDEETFADGLPPAPKNPIVQGEKGGNQMYSSPGAFNIGEQLEYNREDPLTISHQPRSYDMAATMPYSGVMMEQAAVSRSFKVQQNLVGYMTDKIQEKTLINNAMTKSYYGTAPKIN